MTEDEWLAYTDPKPMLELLRGKASDRKLWLFGCACCHRIWHLLPPTSREALVVSERYADGLATHAELLDASLNNYKGADAGGNELTLQAAVAVNLAVVDPARNGIPWLTVAEAASRAAGKVIQVIGFTSSVAQSAGPGGQAEGFRAEQHAQAAIVRDVIGNPFCPVAVNPRWLTTTVISLAQSIYDGGDRDRLTNLADALQGTGCDSVALLTHLRSDGPHVRGCWAVDLVLGKE